MYRDTSRINEYKVIACFDYLCMVNTKELFFSLKPRSPSPCPASSMPLNLQCCPPTSQSGKLYSDTFACSCRPRSSHYMLSTAMQLWSIANAAMEWLNDNLNFRTGTCWNSRHKPARGILLVFDPVAGWTLTSNSVELCHARLHALILPSLAYQSSVTADSDKF